MADPVTLFTQLAEELGSDGVVQSNMFGKPSLKYGSKAIACLVGDVVGFKLGAGSPAHTAALELPGAELFDPSGTGRPMKDWVGVPSGSATKWPELGRSALDALQQG